jgi:hypothetical protein
VSHCSQPQYRGKALPPDHKDSQLVQRIAERIISAVEEGHGGGFQKHIRKVRVHSAYGGLSSVYLELVLLVVLKSLMMFC